MMMPINKIIPAPEEQGREAQSIDVPPQPSLLEQFKDEVLYFVKQTSTGTPITDDSWSGFAMVVDEDDRKTFSASLKFETLNLTEAKAFYSKIELPDFKFIGVDSITALFNGTILRTQLVYMTKYMKKGRKPRKQKITKVVTSQPLMTIGDLNLKGGSTKQPVLLPGATLVNNIKGGRQNKKKQTVTLVETVVKRKRRPRRQRQQIQTVLNGPASLNLKQTKGVARNARAKYSAAGRAWLELYLNPMGKQEPAMCGYPDGSATDAVLAQYRQDYNIVFPTAPNVAAAGGGPYTQAQLDALFPKAVNCTLLFLMPPMLKNVAIMRLYQQTPTALAPSANEQIQNVFPQFDAYGVNGEAINNTAPIGYLQTLIQLDNIDSHADQSMLYRLVSRGLTAEYTVPELEKEGFVTAAQFSTEARMLFRSANATVDSAATPPTTAPFLNEQVLGVPLGNVAPNTLVQAYHGAYTAKCTEGFYMPILSSARDLKFTAPLKQRFTTYDAATGVVGSDIAVDFPTLDWNMGVAWFEGISTGFSIKLKTRSVVEFVPLPGSEITNFSRTTAGEDLRALEAAFTVRHKMAHAYPSSYNDFGWLGDLVEGAVGLIPGIGGFAKPFVKPIWNWVSGKVSSMFGNPIVKDGDVWYDAEN
jgi:hypothetical protein